MRWLGSLAGPTLLLKQGALRLSLVGNHTRQLRLIAVIGDDGLVQLVLTLASFGSEDVPGKRMLPDNLPRPGLFKPFGRTFVCL